MNKRLLLFASLLLVGLTQSLAQQTGSFNTQIQFDTAQRNLAVYVPTNYDPAQSYSLLIGLHGLGDNSNNYRNALINGLSLNTFIPNTIIVCPDGGSDPNRDFYTPLGDEFIIDSAINWAAANYNIDQNQIVLQGFSLGARSALQFGLDYPSRFMGLMLHTPAIQGTKDAVNWYNVWNYANASQIPVTITHGGNDILYTAPIDSAFERLVQNNGKVRYLLFPTMGHTIPAISNVPDYIDWFNDAPPAGRDISVVRLYAPSRNCDPQVPLSVLIQNQAADPVTSVTFEITAGTNTSTYTWTGNLQSWESDTVVLPSVIPIPGGQTVSVTATEVNGIAGDLVTANNQRSFGFEYTDQPVNAPLTQDFESPNYPPPGWHVISSGDTASAYTHDNLVGSQGSSSSIFAFNGIFIFDNWTRREQLISPVVNMQQLVNPALHFDVAFNYLRYTPPYFTDTVDFADTLEVYVSTDCGDTYQLIYKKGGADLATIAQPILNPLSINAGIFLPTANDWRTEVISLTQFMNSPQLQVKFDYISGLGGSFNIDNIIISNNLSVKEQPKPAFNIYPNPASEVVKLEWQNENVSQIEVIDITGRQVMSTSVEPNLRNMHLNVSSLIPGYYLLKIHTKNGLLTEKVLIQR